MHRGLCLTLLLGLWACATGSADELTLGDRTAKGTFTGFGKGQFEFQTWDGQTLHEKAMNVRRLALDKPLKVVLQTRSRKDSEAVLLKGYERGQFRIVRGEREAVERESQVRSIALHESEQSFAGYLERARKAEQAEEKAAESAPPERLEDLLEMGAVTVIHFHQPDTVTSTRQGSYCRRLAEDSHGRLVYRRITIPAPEDPLAVKYGLKTLPQFWFYSRSGKLTAKLTERFSPEDFQDAIAAARKGSAPKDEP